MSVTEVVRPVVRSFKSHFIKQCAAHVRKGGHGVLWENDNRAWLITPVPDDADPLDLALFAIFDMRKQRFERVEKGPLAGLARTLVAPRFHWIVKGRAHRDSVHPGSTRIMRLDCLECGACCIDNEVTLTDEDEARFVAGGRPDLMSPPYARRRDGVLMLSLVPKTKHCKQLQKDNKCKIYEIRPNPCREFPVASEGCLSAREQELNLFDGLERED